MITDKYTKTAWTILAIGLFVISEMSFKNFQSTPPGRKTYIGFELDCKICESPDVE